MAHLGPGLPYVHHLLAGTTNNRHDPSIINLLIFPTTNVIIPLQMAAVNPLSYVSQPNKRTQQSSHPVGFPGRCPPKYMNHKHTQLQFQLWHTIVLMSSNGHDEVKAVVGMTGSNRRIIGDCFRRTTVMIFYLSELCWPKKGAVGNHRRFTYCFPH